LHQKKTKNPTAGIFLMNAVKVNATGFTPMLEYIAPIPKEIA